MTSPPMLCLVRLGRVRSSYLELPNWSHTGINLTNHLRSDLVVIGRVKSGDLTGFGWILSDLVALLNWSYSCSFLDR